MKKLVLIVFTLLLVGCSKEVKINDKGEDTFIDEKPIEVAKCDSNHECETINGKTYKWSKITNIKINEMYNYETEEIEAGTLKIIDGILHFVDLNNETIMKYDYIEGNVIALEEVNIDCDEVIYALITDKGYIYRSDAHEGILVEESFYKVENESKFIKFGVDQLQNEEECTIGNIIGKIENNDVINLSN